MNPYTNEYCFNRENRIMSLAKYVPGIVGLAALALASTAVDAQV